MESSDADISVASRSILLYDFLFVILLALFSLRGPANLLKLNLCSRFSGH